MSFALAGHVALVTGAGRGIGRAIAARLAVEGCSVGLLARTGAELDSAAEALAAAGARTCTVVADVTSAADLEQAQARVRDALGPVSILINNAGYAPPRTPLTRAPAAEWDRVLATCLQGPIRLSRMLLPDMIAAGGGAIVNIGSIAARQAHAGEAVYAAAKAGLAAFTHALFAEVREHGIRVAIVVPGNVDTALIPDNRRIDRSRFLQPHDVADVVLRVLTAPPHACAIEVVVQPQRDPRSTAHA